MKTTHRVTVPGIRTAARAPVPRGFALLESLVALVVVAVSLLALAVTFVGLSRGSDVARQRGQATRFATEQIEAMRSFVRLADDGNGGLSWDTLGSGADILTDNASYQRQWTLSGVATDPFRLLNVRIDWQDRQGEAQSVNLATVIAQVDPSDIGSLGFPLPDNTPLKRPKNRSLDIPVPASDLGNGESAFRLPDTNLAVVFSNDSGWVVRRCALNSVDETITIDELSACSSTHAYLLAGYVSFEGFGRHDPLPTNLGISTAGASGLDSATCAFTDAVDPNTGDTIADYAYYLCVMSVPADGDAWTGRIDLTSPDLNAGDNLWVCRFEYPEAQGLTADQRNVQPYASVAESLLNQNYVISASNSCPTVDGLATVAHQECRSANPQRAAHCPAAP